MSEWSEKTLGEVARFQNGYPFKPADLTGRGFPVVRIKQLLDPSAEVDLSDTKVPTKFLIQDGDLIFSWSGTLSSVIWSRGQAILNQHLFKVTTAGEDVELRWLHYALDHAIADLNTKTHGTTMKHVTKKVLEAQRLRVPAVVDQRRIVDVMSAVDDQIQALAEEGVRARNAYRSASGLLWLDLGDNEATSRPLGDLMMLDVQRITLLDEETYHGVGVLGSGLGLIDKGQFMGRDTEYTAMNVLRADQVVMRKLTAWEGPITVVPAMFDGYVASNEFPTFTMNPEASPGWMRHVCRTQRLWDEMKNRVTGTVQRRKRLNPDQLLAVELPVPSRAAQERITAGLDELERECQSVEDELTRLRAFRSALLTSLLNRDIEIPEAYDALLEVAY